VEDDTAGARAAGSSTAAGDGLNEARRRFDMGTRLKDKISIVTGAGTSGEGMGNGKAAAMLFAREGATIIATCRRTKSQKSCGSAIPTAPWAGKVLPGTRRTRRSFSPPTRRNTSRALNWLLTAV